MRRAPKLDHPVSHKGDMTHTDDKTTSNEPRSGRITDLAATKRDPQRIAVDLDGSFAFALPAELVASERLEVGDWLDEQRVAELLAADERARATGAALAFLAYRARSEREVRDRLRRGRFSQDAIDHAISRLQDWHYLDDEDFARRWVENRSTHRPRGRRMLQQELRQKGISSEMAREVLEEADLDETAMAVALARQRLPAYAGDDPLTVRRRLGGYLARRGYGFDVVRTALNAALGESDDGPDDVSE
jgi:regulatory protein